MTTHSLRRRGSDPSIAASTLRSGIERLTIDVVIRTLTPGIDMGGFPLPLSAARASSASVLPVLRTRLSASATETWPTGIVSLSAHAANVYGGRRAGCAGQYWRAAAAESW